MPTCDLLLRIADAKEYRPLWSHTILEEVERNLRITFNCTSEQAARRMNNMRHHFPDAQVTGYKSLIKMRGNASKDRHVIATAVRTTANLIVTNYGDHAQIA